MATTSRGVSMDPNFVEVITSSAESNYWIKRVLKWKIYLIVLLNLEPPKTNFQVLSTLDDGFNITWTTSDQINAASLFYIKYKKTGN